MPGRLLRKDVDNLFDDVLAFVESKESAYSSIMLVGAMVTIASRMAFECAPNRAAAVDVITKAVEASWKDYCME